MIVLVAQKKAFNIRIFKDFNKMDFAIREFVLAYWKDNIDGIKINFKRQILRNSAITIEDIFIALTLQKSSPRNG